MELFKNKKDCCGCAVCYSICPRKAIEMVEDEYGYGVTYNIDPITLGEDEYFVLGDNRIISLDSRSFGTIEISEIKGTTNFIMYPFGKIGKVE